MTMSGAIWKFQITLIAHKAISKRMAEKANPFN
jgi:hypothetical protein